MTQTALTGLNLFLAVLLSALVFWILDRVARIRTRGDSAVYWVRLSLRFSFLLGPLLLISSTLPSVLPQYWRTGYHLYLDLSGGFGQSFSWCYHLALAVPLIVWTSLAGWGLIEKPAGREVANRLAGSIGYRNKRDWLFFIVLILAAIVLYSSRDLGGGPGAYPGALWSSLVLLAFSFSAIAVSKPFKGVIQGPKEESKAPIANLPQWADAMSSRGIDLELIHEFAGTVDAPSKLPEKQHTFSDQRLKNAYDSLSGPVKTVDGLGPTRLIFAADHSGQVALLAELALKLARRLHAVTVVIVRNEQDTLLDYLKPHLPSDDYISWIKRHESPPVNAIIWLVTAQQLSDGVLQQFKDERLTKRIGLVTWWHLEAYTGVLGANVWAISRRLYRLLRYRGRPDVRTLALMRPTSHAEAQLASFVSRILPLRVSSKEDEIYIESSIARPLFVYLLKSHVNFFHQTDNLEVQERHRHLPLIAAKMSVEARWPTYIELPNNISSSEAEGLLQSRSPDHPLREKLLHRPVDAGVQIRPFAEADALSLVEQISQGGRLSDQGLSHHVALVVQDNPYLMHLLGQLKQGQFLGSRRLICAEASISIIRRHLLLALDEMPDTLTNLKQHFLWQEDAIRHTLTELAKEGRLEQTEVRFLDDKDGLCIDYLYQSRFSPDEKTHPLDTVSEKLLEVRDPTSGQFEEGVRLRIDPQRLTIVAYPHRVFMYQGRRYRVREWYNAATVLAKMSVDCELEDSFCQTYRIRNAEIYKAKLLSTPVTMGRGKLLSRVAADVTYEEEVVGTLRIDWDMTKNQNKPAQTIRLDEPVMTAFDTRALLLSFAEPAEQQAIASVCQALRHVLPVHLGVEEDALEIVPLVGEPISGLDSDYGFAIVDLYPGSIGLIDAISDDTTLLVQLLQWTRGWLDQCPCKSESGCELCLRSPSSLWATVDQPLSRTDALQLLNRII